MGHWDTPVHQYRGNRGRKRVCRMARVRPSRLLAQAPLVGVPDEFSIPWRSVGRRPRQYRKLPGRKRMYVLPGVPASIIAWVARS